MEIHAPHHPIMSFKEFLVHLSMVTVGILIALGLEQSVESYHHYHLAEEARQNMLTEIAENKKELDAHLSGLKDLQKQRRDDVRVIERMLAHEHMTEMSMSLNFANASLNSASWATASTVGALAYMGYGDVKQFAEIYRQQDFYNHLQDDEVKNVQIGLGMMNSFDGPSKPSDEELRAIRRQLLQSDAALVVLGQLGQQLTAGYAKLLPNNQPR
jgi:hypothetical protein